MSQQELFVQALNDCWKKEASAASVVQNLRNLSLDITPDYLYRYRECNAINFDSLRNRSLSFSSPTTFSDPEDSLITVSDELFTQIKRSALSDPVFTVLSEALRSESYEELEKHLEKIPGTNGMTKEFVKEAAQRNLPNNAQRFIEMNDDQIRQQLAQIIDEIAYCNVKTNISEILRNSTRVACLCENKNSTKMWEKYADNGKGFQIAYSRNRLFGLGTDLLNLPVIFPVIYVEKRPEMPSQLLAILFAMLNQQVVNSFFALQSQLFVYSLPVLYYKQMNPYSFEQEWRIVLNSQTLNEQEEQFVSRICPCSFIRIGPNTSTQNIRTLQSLANDLGIPLVSNENTEVPAAD